MRDRYGVWRHYLRRPGFKRVALSGLYGSEEFALSYALAMGGKVTAVPHEIGAGRTVAGSLNALIASYLNSKHWTAPPPEGLAKNSKHTRKPIIEKLRSGPWGNVMLHDIERRHVRAILDRVAKGHQRKHWLKTMRSMFAHGVEVGLLDDDPSVGIKVKLPKSDGYHTWEASEIEQYRDYWPLGTEARLALELGLETASRRCEIARIGRQHIRNGRIRVARVKGCNAVDIPISAALQAALDAMPANAGLTYLPYTPEQLGDKFAEWATEAGLAQACRLHGLRKSRTAQLASSGASAHVIMAITGHKSLSEVQRYADRYDRVAAADAAMALLQAATEREQKCKTA
jgi:integrase